MNENEKEEKEIIEKTKLINPLKAILTEDTMVEDVQAIIDRDPEPERRNEFKKAEEIISALAPEPTKKRKNSRKAKEKEEFDRDLAIARQNQLQRQKQQEQKMQEQSNKQMERGE